MPEEAISKLEILLDTFPFKYKNKTDIQRLKGDIEAYMLSRHRPCDEYELFPSDKSPLEFIYTPKNDWFVINSRTGRLLKVKFEDIIEFLRLKRVTKKTYKGIGRTDGAYGLETTLQKTIPLVHKHTVIKILEIQESDQKETEAIFNIYIQNEHKRKRRYALRVSQLKSVTYRFKPSAKRILIHSGKSKEVHLYIKAELPAKPRQNFILYLNERPLSIRTTSQTRVNKVFREEEKAYREKFLKISYPRAASTIELFIKPDVFKEIHETKCGGQFRVIRPKETP